MTRPRAALFYGAGPTFVWAFGGWVTSIGVWRLANTFRGMGIEAQCFDFDQVTAAYDWLSSAALLGQPIIGVGYSLGNTAVLYLQTLMRMDLVFSIAASELAGSNNRPIDHNNTRRSILWRGPGVLSGAGGGLGYDEVHDIDRPHLLMDFAGPVQDSAVNAAKLILGTK